MGLAEHYDGYKWIKVKRYDGVDVNLTPEENYSNFTHHHEKETTFLINEIRRLAVMIDEIIRDIIQRDAQSKLGDNDAGNGTK